MGLRGREGIGRERLLAALDATKWVVKATAKRLKMSRQAVYWAMERHSISLGDAPPARADALRRRRRAGANATNGRAA